ncbi:Sporulation related [Shewanella denitrificans OS217]|jgi:DamX protein|uniref:Sporulation related n=2 Tax=Shewanella TaxID=22 RepID=Q12SL7_SHEDO|nr:Sporulation related [Shewanella denitrificans OS217]
MLLLPTQEMLVQRLQHMASYSEQLLVLCGAKGSGKSTLAAALASELEEINSALVVCPQHVDSNEIRRKILIQLISDPIFDDELPLTDTLLRIQSYLTKPLHIIIDDAHLLPKVLWAECILLSQMSCGGKHVSVTFTIENKFWQPLLAELGKAVDDSVLQVIIEPLPIAEREALYQSLLLRSEQDAFTPRNIVSGLLEKQAGTPAEVVSLLATALETKNANKHSPKRHSRLISFMGILAAILAWWLFTNPSLWNEGKSLGFSKVKFASEVERLQDNWLIDYGQQLLSHYWWQRNSPLNLHLSPGELLQTELVNANQNDDEPLTSTLNQTDNGGVSIGRPDRAQPLGLQEKATQQDKDIAQAQELAQRQLNSETSPPLAKLAPVSVVGNVSVAAENTKAVPASRIQNNVAAVKSQSPTAKVKPEANLGKAPYKNGYTLQLANVTQRASLRPILTQIPRSELVIHASQTGHFLLFVGNFSSEAQARNKAAELKRLGLGDPWLRRWADLQQYSFE